MVTYNQVLVASLALTAKLVSAQAEGTHKASSTQNLNGGTYSAAACKTAGKNCVATPSEGSGELSTGWIIFIVVVISLPILGGIAYLCCGKKEHNVDDDSFHRIKREPIADKKGQRISHKKAPIQKV